jgi:TatD DNase family protein
MLIDTHAHLDFPEFNQDRDEVILRAKEKGIALIVNIGSSLQGSQRSLELAKKYDSVYATIGIHPHEADKFSSREIAIIQELAKQDKVVAIGEIGLDYFLPARPVLPVGKAGKNFSKSENQRPLFTSLLKLAKDLNLPLVIHSREAEADTLKSLKSILPHKIVIHCFSGDGNFLKECLDLGIFISFTCNITYKKAENLRNLVKAAPLDRFFLETDAPYLSPEGLRGRRNEPANIRILAEEVARIKQISFEEVAKVTTESAKAFFNLK